MAKVFVYLWFDIEDYVTKESDELIIIALDILKKYNVPVTCKIVAEKIRSLEENGREDVIAALSRQEVGFHLDTHSRHPTLYEYLADLDVLSGSKEFVAREGAGLKKLVQTFSKNPSCFGHAGPTFAPHPYLALREMKIPIYLDETRILNVNNEPYWYCGILSLNGANRNFIKFDYFFKNENSLEILKRKFQQIHDRIQKRGSGAASIVFHLHTAINKKFWDEVNFADGKNIPKENYKRPPPQPASITKRAWTNFDEFVRFMSTFPDVTFITASDAARIYRRSDIILNRLQLAKLVKYFRKSNTFLKVDNQFVSPAEAFYVVTRTIIDYHSGFVPDHVTAREPLGPLAPFKSVGKRSVQTNDFITAAKRTLDLLDSENRLPVHISVGENSKFSPHDFLAAACKLLQLILSGKQPSETLTVPISEAPNRQYIHSAAFKQACKWNLLPSGFKAPKILEQIKLQAWTLKPATPLPSLQRD